MAFGPCRRCGQLVSWEEAACPHCGAKDPAAEFWERPRRSEGAELLQRVVTAIIVVVVVLSLLALLTQAEPVLESWRDWLPIPL